MGLFKIVNGERVDLTPEEIADNEARQAEWLAEMEAENSTRNLTAPEFQWLLGMNADLDDAWDALWAYCKANDRRAFATLRSQQSSDNFRLEVTLRLVDGFSAQLTAAGHNVTAERVTTAWAETIEHFNQQHEQGD